jgi:Protein of unknown function (DUF1236)
MKLPKTQTAIALAAALSLAGISAASATGISSSSAMPNASAATKMAPPASDSLSLSGPQQHTAWNDLYVKSLNQNAPSGFDATAGTAVPNGVKIAPVPGKAASDIPALKPYDFAMLQHKLLIVNPNDKKIVEVITR